MEEYDSSMIMIFVWFISSQSANKLFMSFFMISFMSTENKNNTSNKIQTQTSGQKLSTCCLRQGLIFSVSSA